MFCNFLANYNQLITPSDSATTFSVNNITSYIETRIMINTIARNLLGVETVLMLLT